ncbi:MAG: pyruvate kinase [Planctomycetes bacterium]|nr:pyruvate kinase [Planctomycetota bacterium]
MHRRTRIVATLGPATDRPGVLEKLIDAGLDVARINFSHGAAEEPRHRIKQLRQLARERKRNVAVLADLPGPKLRVILHEPMKLETGHTLTVALKPTVPADLQLTEPEALAKIKAGHRVLFDDGRLQARVLGVTRELVTLGVEVGGTLLPNKGLNLPDTELTIPAVTKRDREAIAVAVEAQADWIALSFVRDASAAHELRGVIRGYNAEIPILAKIERPEAVKRSAEIIDAFDGIMVARGDLGVEIPLERVPHVQKRLIQEARAAGKPVITATDMLDSMRNNPRPTRAEASDVANAVYDGTDAVMLSGETAIGDFPVEALACMNRILLEAETHQADDGPRHLTVPRGELCDHITHAVCDLARETGAAAIITPTLTGRTARLVARHRTSANIIAVATEETVVQRLALVWGVQAVGVPFGIERGDDRLEAAVRAAFLNGVLVPGAIVVVLAGHPIEGGEGFPTIRVVRVGPDGGSCEP